MKEGKLFIRPQKKDKIGSVRESGKLYIKDKKSEVTPEANIEEGELRAGQRFLNRDMKEVFTITSVRIDEEGEHILLESDKGIKVSRAGAKFRIAVKEGVWQSDAE